MKTIDAILLGVCANLLAWGAVAATSTATNAPARPPAALVAAAGDEVLGQVKFEDAPLMEVIKTLCAQARISYQVDPQVEAAIRAHDKPDPMVNLRMENVTARQVLTVVLNNYGCELVQDPKTTICRVAFKDASGAAATTADSTNKGILTNAAPAVIAGGKMASVASVAVSTNAAPPAPSLILEDVRTPVAAADTNAPVDLGADQTAGSEADEMMPLVTFEDAPLLDVIKTLCRQAKINFQFDPRIQGAVGLDGKPAAQPTVGLRLENVTARQVLMAVLSNYGYQLVLDPKTQISRITIKDPAAPEPLITKIIQLQYGNPTNIMVVIKASLPSPTRSMVVPDVRTSQLVVMATEKEMEAVDSLVRSLDAPTRQILIEARLLETSQNPQSVKGIDWSGTLEAQHVSFGNGQTTSSSTTTTPGAGSSVVLPSGRTVASDGGSSSASTYTTTMGSGGSSSGSSGGVLPSTLPGGLSMNSANGFSPNVAFLNADGVSAVLSFLNKDSDTEVVSTPRAVTLDNETATLEVTRAFPIFQITPGSANVAGGSQIQYTNLGTRLTVTPRISGSNSIALHVQPEVSNIDGKDQQTINGQLNVANIYAIRKIETHVVIPSGHTLVMGGLMSDSNTKAQTKVPILGDLPGIGLAFRKDSKTRLKQNLLIFITPSIVRNEDFQSLAESNFLQTKAADSSDKKTSPWDSGKPVDWNKPIKDQY
jgi:type II secretory pathway component GspD/PulD (secretin)